MLWGSNMEPVPTEHTRVPVKNTQKRNKEDISNPDLLDLRIKRK